MFNYIMVFFIVLYLEWFFKCKDNRKCEIRREVGLFYYDVIDVLWNNGFLEVFYVEFFEIL